MTLHSNSRLAARSGPAHGTVQGPAAGVMQLRCACGNRSTAGGECAACGQASVQRKSRGGVEREDRDARTERATAPTEPVSVGATGDFARLPVHGNTHTATAARAGSPLPFLDAIQRSFGRHDVSGVRAHTDRTAAMAALKFGAEAFAVGADVSFARAPSLHTAAHEAAHVVQQRAGLDVSGGVGHEGDRYERHADAVADAVTRGESSERLLDATPGTTGNALTAPVPVRQLRRIPPNVRALLTSTTGPGKGENFDANAEGVLRLIELAMAELTPVQRAKVRTERLAGKTDAQFDALPRQERRSRYAEAIRKQFPDLELGDPKLLDMLPRPLTADVANITKVVGHADTVYADIASGARDVWLTQVFGATSLVAAKAKYAKGRTAMNTLHASNHIVTDRGSGFSGQVFEGGLTGPSQISIMPSVIDTPDTNGSCITLIHESMHAGNSDVKDDVYIDAPGFTTQSETQKLLNAAHFEVVPWRIKDPADARAFPGVPPVAFQTFIPPGTTVAGVTAPLRTISEDASVAAYTQIRAAWALGLNLHRQYVKIFADPTQWTAGQFGGAIHYNDSVPFWSKVQKMTVHMKTVIDPTSSDPAKHPVSQIDIALSEGFTRRLGFGMFVFTPLRTDAQILAFEAAKATVAERNAAFPGGVHSDQDKERDLLVKLALREPSVAPITGTVARDVRVVAQFNAVGNLWSNILAPRNPSTFAD